VYGINYLEIYFYYFIFFCKLYIYKWQKHIVVIPVHPVLDQWLVAAPAPLPALHLPPQVALHLLLVLHLLLPVVPHLPVALPLPVVPHLLVALLPQLHLVPHLLVVLLPPPQVVPHLPVALKVIN